jgi:hypothetical protein
MVAGGFSTWIELLQLPNLVHADPVGRGLIVLDVPLAVLDAALVVLDARGRVGCMLVEPYAALVGRIKRSGV